MKNLSLDDIRRAHQELGIQKWDTNCRDYIGSDNRLALSCTVTLTTSDGRAASYTSIASPEDCGGKDDRGSLRSYAEDSAYCEVINRLQTLKDDENTNYRKDKPQSHVEVNSPPREYVPPKISSPVKPSVKEYNHSKTKPMSENQEKMILGRCYKQRLDAEKISHDMFGHNLKQCTSYEADKIINHIKKLNGNDYF
jgi:hypothetical protein